MINFTVGPVQMEPEIRAIGAEELPYFRTPEFSAVMKENEALMCQFMKAESGSRAVFLTGSGTSAMEAGVMNLFTAQDKLLIVNGGSFGARFVKICQIHKIPFTEIRLECGKALRSEHLEPYAAQGYTGFVVNVHETSTGVYYDMELISRFCRENQLCLVVDAISSFLADDFRMEEWGVDLAITGSQKALALPPGIAVMVLNQRAVKRVQESQFESLYLDLKAYLKDGERGQTPFTPAVGILLQMHRRLKRIEENGLATEQTKIRALAEDFRGKLSGLPFEMVSESLSAAETSLHPTGIDAEGLPVSAYRVFEILKDEYGIWVCPNGGELADTVFRVGHMGNLTSADNDALIHALIDMQSRGLI